MTVRVRYDYPDESGDTRRERNARVDTPSPPRIIPDEGRYIWDWYEELSESCVRVIDGVCHNISATAMKDWAEVFGHIVYHHEYAILRAMDKAFCAEMNKEFKAYRARQKDAGA